MGSVIGCGHGTPVTGQDVQVVAPVAVGLRHYMIAPGHQNEVAVAHRQSLIEVALVRVHPLEGEALRAVLAVIVDLLQFHLSRWPILVVLVGRVAGPVPGRRQHLDEQEPVGGELRRYDMVDGAATSSGRMSRGRPGRSLFVRPTAKAAP
jgi:hypothetical protein